MRPASGPLWRHAEGRSSSPASGRGSGAAAAAGWLWRALLTLLMNALIVQTLP